MARTAKRLRPRRSSMTRRSARASMESTLARSSACLMPRRRSTYPKSPVGMTSASTQRPVGASTRPTSAMACCWSAQWWNVIVLNTRSKLASGNGSRSAVACWNLMRFDEVTTRACSTIPSAGSTPSSVASGKRSAAVRSNRPVPQPTSRIALGFGTAAAKSSTVRCTGSKIQRCIQ